ncbi:MAG: hypothetical protein SV760_05830 [Halobacteria archaeon]|nr:hypothetical protein [Halobacteria archaeon]
MPTLFTFVFGILAAMGGGALLYVTLKPLVFPDFDEDDREEGE